MFIYSKLKPNKNILSHRLQQVSVSVSISVSVSVSVRVSVSNSSDAWRSSDDSSSDGQFYRLT